MVGKDLFALRTDLLIRFDPELASHAQDFASDNALFLDTFAAAWTKVMNQDRFDGPTGNICDAGCNDAKADPDTAFELGAEGIAGVAVGVALLLAVVVIVVRCRAAHAAQATSPPTVEMVVNSPLDN